MLYGIVGTGDANPTVVYDSLVDLHKDGDTYLIAKGVKPELVDSWVEIRSKDEVTVNVPVKEVFEALEDNKGALLLVWDESKPDLMNKYVFAAVDNGIEVLDVANGLAVITVTDAKSPAEAPESPQDEPNPSNAVEDDKAASERSKRLEKALKDIDAQYGEKWEKWEKRRKKGAEEEEDLQLPIDLGTFRIVKTEPNVSVTDGEQTCMLTVVMPGGIVMSRPTNPYEAKQLFGFASSI